MGRRVTDNIDEKIEQWEAMRGEFGPDAPQALDEFIAGELARLRHERSFHSHPQSGGRRATDGKASA